MYSEDDLLPISALQHFLFCERPCALIHVEQVWVLLSFVQPMMESFRKQSEILTTVLSLVKKKSIKAVNKEMIGFYCGKMVAGCRKENDGSNSYGY